jgi:lysophospholipase L1-like esterase
MHKSGNLNTFYELKPGVHKPDLPSENVTGQGGPVYKINSDTLNQTYSVSISKPENVFRIAALGDSFTFGYNVNTEDAYPFQLQEIINKNCKGRGIEVINLGVPGYDFEYSVERYRIRGQKYNPDLVLWFIIGDDMLRLNEKNFPEIKRIQSRLKTYGLLGAVYKSGYIRTIASEIRQEAISQIGGEEKFLNLQENILLSLRKYFDQKVLIFINSDMPKKYEDFLKAVSYKADYYFYSKLPKLTFSDKSLLRDSHPSPKGHRLIAENLFGYLTKNDLIPCQY